MPSFFSPRYSSFERVFKVLMRREIVGYVANIWMRNGRYPGERRAASVRAPTLDERIAERVARERQEGRYDGPGSPRYRETRPRPPATRSNGGLRGSTATRWVRGRGSAGCTGTFFQIGALGRETTLPE